MTITPDNQPHTPQLQIDLDEVLSGIAFIAECTSATNARHPSPS